MAERPSAELTTDPSARVRDCRLGRYTEVGARTRMSETTPGDDACIVEDGEMIHAEIGESCAIAGVARVLEIGTLGGTSTIWLARAVGPDGRVVTLEANPGHAGVARADIARASSSDRVEMRGGRALDATAVQTVASRATTASCSRW